MDELLRYMRALVLLSLNDIKEEEERQGPDVVLSRAGFTNPEIAQLLGRTAAAVQKAIERSRKASRKAPRGAGRKAKR